MGQGLIWHCRKVVKVGHSTNTKHAINVNIGILITSKAMFLMNNDNKRGKAPLKIYNNNLNGDCSCWTKLAKLTCYDLKITDKNVD